MDPVEPLADEIGNSVRGYDVESRESHNHNSHFEEKPQARSDDESEHDSQADKPQDDSQIHVLVDPLFGGGESRAMGG
jgi:hypothetical protein